MERTVNRPGPPSASRAFPKAHVSRRLPTVADAARGTLGRASLKMRGGSRTDATYPRIRSRSREKPDGPSAPESLSAVQAGHSPHPPQVGA